MYGKAMLMFNVRNYCSGKNPLTSGVNAPKEHSCGIPPWHPDLQIDPPKKEKLPEFLIRPPCLPGSKPGEPQTCLRGLVGLYCPPCRISYKYPPFSENIDFMPNTNTPPCWWKSPLACMQDPANDEKIKGLSRGWDCPID